MSNIPTHKLNWTPAYTKKPNIEEKRSPSIINSENIFKKDSVRLQDLCKEDKKKIGTLAKKLCKEKQKRKSIEDKLVRNEERYENELHKAIEENQKILNEFKELKSGYEESLSFFKNVAETNKAMHRYSVSPIPTYKIYDTLVENTNPFMRCRNISNASTEENLFRSKTPTIPSRADKFYDFLDNSRRKFSNVSELSEKTFMERSITPTSFSSFLDTPNQSVGTQTPVSKKIQAEEKREENIFKPKIFVPKLKLNEDRSQAKTIEQSKALKEVKNLQKDLSVLSNGLKSLNQNCVESIKNSQYFVPVKEKSQFRPSNFFDALNPYLKKRGLSYDFDKENIISINQHTSAHKKAEQKINRKIDEDIENIVIGDGYYDENLFKVIEEIDK